MIAVIPKSNLRDRLLFELLKDTIQKRLGHRKLQTTLVYAEHSDVQADAELRARQHRRVGAESGSAERFEVVRGERLPYA